MQLNCSLKLSGLEYWKWYFLFSLRYSFFHCQDSSPMWHVLCPVSAPSGLPAPLLSTFLLPLSFPPYLSHFFLMNVGLLEMMQGGVVACSQICLPWTAFRRSQGTCEGLQDGLLLTRKRRSWLDRRNQCTLHPCCICLLLLCTSWSASCVPSDIYIWVWGYGRHAAHSLRLLVQSVHSA